MIRSTCLVKLAVIAILATPAPSAAAVAPSMRDVLAATYAVRDLSAVDLAPDGRTVVWEETFHDPNRLLGSTRSSALYAQPLEGGARMRITAGNGGTTYDEETPLWSPNGREIAFLSDAHSKGQLQIYVAAADGVHIRQLGNLRGDVQRLSWSPSGRTLAFLYIAAAH
ncbi:MAG: hypothetical protein WBW76_13435, partial [Candidatus Cybelea sp.]